MRPSETTSGQAWLDNFLPEDCATATALVDSLSFVRLSTMRTRLVRWLDEAEAKGTIQQPAVLVPALSIEDIGLSATGSTRSPGNRPIAYETFSVGEPILATPGSEGFIGNLVRDMVQRPGNTGGWLSPGTTLDELRAGKCKSIVVVTDYSGSGTQLIEFARTFVRNATIRSWRSGGLVQIHGVAFAASSVAQEAATRTGSPLDKFHTVVAAPSFGERPWTPELRQAVEQFCVRKAFRASDALGYQKAEACSLRRPVRPTTSRRSYGGLVTIGDHSSTVAPSPPNSLLSLATTNRNPLPPI